MFFQVPDLKLLFNYFLYGSYAGCESQALVFHLTAGAVCSIGKNLGNSNIHPCSLGNIFFLSFCALHWYSTEFNCIQAGKFQEMQKMEKLDYSIRIIESLGKFCLFIYLVSAFVLLLQVFGKKYCN